MKKFLLILFLLTFFSLGFKEFKVDSIVNILNVFDEGERLGLVKIENISFKRDENKINGFIDFIVEEKNISSFENFLKDKGINFIEIKEGFQKIYLKEFIKNYSSNDFKTIFLLKFSEIFSSKNFYFIILITIIFYLLILPNI